ncbi:E3 ubiquitin-protein ligase TRIM45-like [Glandiceps talaboti]
MASRDSTFLKQIDENFLVCCLCSERYNNAKLLPCLHSFCETCLTKLVKEYDELECSFCRRQYVVPNGRVDDLVTDNFFLNELVTQFKEYNEETVKLKKCEACDEGETISRCIECAINLCELCARAHSKLPLTNSHQLMALDKYQQASASGDATSVQSPIYCPKHGNHTLQYYCDTCDVALCLECTVIDHRAPEHKHQYLKDAAAKYRTDLTQLVDDVKKKSDEAKGGAQYVQIMLDALNRRHLELQNQVTKHVEDTILEISNKIKEDGKGQKTILKLEYERRNQMLKAQLKELNNQDDDLKSVLEYAENLLYHANDAHLMYSKKGVTSHIEELRTSEINNIPVDDDCMEFQASHNFFKDQAVGMLNLEHSTGKYEVSHAPKYVRIDDEVKIKLERCKRISETCFKKAEDIRATVTGPDQALENLTVIDNTDDTLTVSFRGKHVGEHALSIKVRNHHIQGSPVTVNVIRKKGLIYSFGKAGSEDGQFKGPWGITRTNSGRLLVCDRLNKRIQLFDWRTKQHHQTIRFHSLQFDKEFNPVFAAVGINESIFITDTDNSQIIVCDENGKLIRMFGKGELEMPFGIAISPTTHRVYVVDLNTHCVKIYTQNGELIDTFGTKGTNDGQFGYPHAIAINKEGEVFVCDKGNNRVQVFDADGHFLYKFGSGDRVMQPVCLAIDKNDDLYVCYHNTNRILKFDSRGNLICRIDEDKDRLDLPSGVYVTDDEPYGQVVVADWGNNCVKVFAQ